MKPNWGIYSDIELFELIQKKSENSEKAFSELYHRYSDRLFNYCIKILGNYQDAKDVFQETFVKFYQNASKLELKDNIRALLFTIARNLAINSKLISKRYTELNEEFYFSAEFEHENKEALEMISKALEILPFVQREAFILRHYQGLSYEEMAKILLIDPVTLRNRVKRAIFSLQKILKPFFDNVPDRPGLIKNKKKIKHNDN